VNQAYWKNLKIQMPRCPVRSNFPDALKLLEKQFLTGFMFDKIMPLSVVVEGMRSLTRYQPRISSSRPEL